LKKKLQFFKISNVLFYFILFKNPGGGNGEKDFLQTSFLSFIDAKTFELICTTTRRGGKNKILGETSAKCGTCSQFIQIFASLAWWNAKLMWDAIF
jgi:hypothetical protein